MEVSCVVKRNCGCSFNTVFRSLLMPVPISFRAAHPHPTHLDTVAAARTIVVEKLRAAVMAMPYLALMLVDIARLSLPPAAGTVVILY